MKNALYILLTLSVAVNCFVAYNFTSFKKRTAAAFSNQEGVISSLEESQALHQKDIRDALQSQFQYENSNLNKNVVLLDLNGNKIDFNSLISKSPKFIYRITTNSCDVCWDNINNKVKMAGEVIGQKNVIVITPLKELRKTLSTYKSMGINVSVYATTDDTVLGISLEKYFSPFFFIGDKHLTIKHLFIPHKNGIEITDDYINAMKQKYFSTSL